MVYAYGEVFLLRPYKLAACCMCLLLQRILHIWHVYGGYDALLCGNKVYAFGAMCLFVAVSIIIKNIQ